MPRRADTLRLPRALSAAAAEAARSVVSLRRDIHAHPELGLRERRTGALAAAALRELGLEVRTGIAKTGVIGILRGARPGPVTAIRADMDCLPIQEATGLPYASTVDGLMHACGHDGHTATALGAARALTRLRGHLAGTVVFLFQPAEENAGGGDLMCRAGALDDPPVEAVFALHCCTTSPLGTITVKTGVMSAQAGGFRLTIVGQDAHGAYPHRGVDPIVCAARIIDGLQTIVSREVFAHDAVVLTVGTIQGGTAPNRIPDKVELSGTLRTTSDAVRNQVQQAMRRLIAGTAKAHRARYKLTFSGAYPPVNNDAALTDLVRRVGRSLLGPERVLELEYPSMGGEDFSYFQQRVPGTMFRLGMVPPGKTALPSVHTDKFDFNDDALETGILVFCGAVMGYAGQTSR